jgi:predicted site-specific integrase-resolvase
METRERQWVTMREASQEVGVSLTTLRDWYRSGAIDTRGQSLGRVIDLDQVRQMAMGSPRGAARRRGLQDRVADAAEQARRQTLLHTPLMTNLLELQELARERSQD